MRCLLFLSAPGLAGLCLVALLNSPAVAEQKRWTVDVQVMIQPSPRDRINAQKWGNAFYRLGRRATFRQGRQGERTRVEQVDEAGGRRLRVVGLMNRDGTISFGRKTFRISAPKPLNDWLTELQIHGPKGPADASATWGLSDVQLTDVLRQLGQVVTDPVDERSPVAVLDSLKLRPDFQVTFTDEARRRIGLIQAEPKLNSDYVGITRGTVFAAALAQFGLGYRPKISDRGSYLLEIDAGDESSNLFPVGWKSTTPITLLVPELQQQTTVDLEKAVPVKGLVDLIAGKLNRPVLYSTHDLAVAGTDVETAEYSRPRGRLSMHSLLSAIARTHQMDIAVRVDEAGRAFLWVTTEQQDNAFQKRFAHVKPAP